jgi:hypothetical protein
MLSQLEHWLESSAADFSFALTGLDMLSGALAFALSLQVFFPVLHSAAFGGMEGSFL